MARAAKTAKVTAAPRKKNGDAAPKAKKPGVGALTKELILKGWNNEKVIAELQKKFPEAANSASNVNFYRTALRKTGELPAVR